MLSKVEGHADMGARPGTNKAPEIIGTSRLARALTLDSMPVSRQRRGVVLREG